MQGKERDLNTRLGDISYQLSRVVSELRILRELFLQTEITISPDEFNRKWAEKNAQK